MPKMGIQLVTGNKFLSPPGIHVDDRGFGRYKPQDQRSLTSVWSCINDIKILILIERFCDQSATETSASLATCKTCSLGSYVGISSLLIGRKYD